MSDKKKVFWIVRVARYWIFCVVLYRSSFVLFGPFPFVIMLSVLRFVVFDYPFGIIKLFFNMITDILFSGFLFILLIILCNISNYLRCEKKSPIYPHVHPQFLVVSVLLIFLVFLCCVLFILVLCHVCPMLPVSLDCPSVFSNVYLHNQYRSINLISQSCPIKPAQTQQILLKCLYQARKVSDQVFVSFYDIAIIGFLNCSNSALFLCFVLF
jgi:hypothetical protein